MAKKKQRKRRSLWYVESDGGGPYIVEEKHGRVATIECESFKRNGGTNDWKRATLMAHAPIMMDDLLRLTAAVDSIICRGPTAIDCATAEERAELTKAMRDAKATIVSAITIRTPTEAE